MVTTANCSTFQPNEQLDLAKKILPLIMRCSFGGGWTGQLCLFFFSWWFCFMLKAVGSERTADNLVLFCRFFTSPGIKQQQLLLCVYVYRKCVFDLSCTFHLYSFSIKGCEIQLFYLVTKPIIAWQNICMIGG